MIYQLEDDPEYNAKFTGWKYVKVCTSPQHNPPTHLYIPPGNIAIHTCPGCGKETKMQGSTVIW